MTKEKKAEKAEKKSDSPPVTSPQVYEPGHEQPINLPKGPNLGAPEEEKS